MPAYLPFAVRVVRVQRLSPTFVRVTVAGDSLAGFAGHGFDQRINLLFPPPGAGPEVLPAGPDWVERWQSVPADRRPPLRTYTVRAFRPERRELDLDFVLHGDVGPASRWAGAARPGDPITVIGPVAGEPGPVTDVAWAPPAHAGRLLLAADEAAVPAASSIVELLGPDVRATVVLEVPEPADVLEIDAPPGVTVIWLSRDRGEVLGPVVRELVGQLVPAVVGAGRTGSGRPPLPADGSPVDGSDQDDDPWEVPASDDPDRPDGFYAWLAGEAGAVVAMRRHLVGERGLDRRAVAFMGYWRRGREQPN
ncbi:NADPH-dependent ferric siderophore reductase [Micromonospora pisi]|uniref:NADPH-dependent ferric siderophore reductase n=1 Tax=Micromonospora pisi TaxID=589240 RepID=A0A495JBL9_9ACTN|nr:siderophore-interacting protein [Micromonospora pisi]RKR85908.1 NADPH-dependent ferric siderophore reductase [Micromonospora pisi]